MKKYNRLIIIGIFIMSFFINKNVYAYDSNNYKYRNLCGYYEVAGFHEDGEIVTVNCFNNYESAKAFMKENNATDLAIMTKYNGETKIIDANVGLLDLSVNPTTLTYFYENSELTSRQYTYMDTGSLYGGVDGAILDSAYSSAKSKWTAKVRIGNFTGWIPAEAYEVVPITWVKSVSYYSVTNEYIKHNYVNKIQNDFSGSRGSIIGPKPEMLKTGNYYSYDGHYFYKDLETMIRDYRNGNYNNSENKNNPYYNYYMYLSNHTRTSYSSINIDEYIRNNLGYKENVFGHTASNNTSRLYGSGTFFYYAQEKYGVNAILSLSLSRNETANGRSYLAINKNNGFGLDAVDSNPIGGAKSYATYQSSILGYASKWITYGYAHPRDGRYFGPQFGDKWIGMNVKYASDTYWSEKMASNYYSMDKALGLQDYNYYQLGVVNKQTNSYSDASTNSKFVYQYPEAEDAVVIVDEVEKNNEKWYKVVSDLNIDNNFNEIYFSGDYNWNGYVYVKASDINKINKGKNGYISPNEVTEYQNKDYEYDLLVENGYFKPKVGISTKNTKYYYDSSLVSETGKTLLKDRYVIVHSIAYKDNQPVAFLVTSDYFHDQKEWVSADSIKFTDTAYGYVTVDTESNQYTWVNYNTEDAAYSKIGGLYTYTYVPVLEQVTVGSDIWYKVPVNLTGNDNVYGYTLSKFSNYITVELSTPVVENMQPTIKADDKILFVDEEFKPLENVEANDMEDGNLTNKIEIIENTVNTKTPGEYKVTYKVVDSKNKETTKTIKVTVKENKSPIITAEDITLKINDEYDPKANVKATDEEDGDLTNKIEIIENTVKTKTPGEYKVTYKVVDSKNKETTKTIKVTVKDNTPPVIIAKNITINQDDEYDPKANVKATDEEDGDLTNKIKITKNTVNTKAPGEYIVIYEVEDSNNKKTTKEIKVTVIEKDEEIEDEIDLDELLENLEDGEFYLDNLSWDKTNKVFTISGYLIILNHNNTLDKEYALILVDKETEDVYAIEIDSWDKNTPYDLGEDNGYSYTNSWFKGKIDFTDIPNGDYDLYMLAATEEKFTMQLVNNFFNQEINRRGEDKIHGYNFKVQQKKKTKPVELSIRDELYTTSESPTTRNMVNGYEEITFKNNKLYIYGYSYDYNGIYSNQLSINRKIIFENTKDYKQTTYDIGSTKGPFDLKTQDGKDKTYAWFENEIDLSKLDKGTYSILVYTKTTNAEDYDEIVDVFRNVNEEITINNKNYKITYNKDRNNRIELIVK